MQPKGLGKDVSNIYQLCSFGTIYNYKHISQVSENLSKMDNKLALTTAVTLAHRESLCPDSDLSVDLIRQILELVKVSEVNIGAGSENTSVANVKTTLADICRQAEAATYHSEDLLSRLRVNIIDDEGWYSAIEKSVKAKLDELALMKSINVLRGKCKAIINQEKISRILRESSSEWNFRHSNIEDPHKFVHNVCSQLEGVMTHDGSKDNAVLDEVDFDKIDTVENITDQVHAINSGVAVWKSGWQDFNDMFQGGLRGGETIVCGALPHNDKTGTTLSLFRQFTCYNKPVYRKPNKKPTLVRLTLEDPLSNNISYLYKAIVFNETGQEVDETKVDPKVMAQVVRDHLTSTGFAVRMARVDPSDWSYRSLQNYVLKLEAEGHDVQVLMVDYLSMIPTTGCRQGPTGTDLQDLFRRMRNFCAARGILLVTPHQLSTQAREYTKGILTDEAFLPFIALKGFWQDARGLDREFDGAFYVHLIKKQDVTYKAFQRDKHRWPGILEESKKYFIYQYPGKMPIPDDIGKERIGMKKIGRPVSNTSSDMFGF